MSRRSDEPLWRLADTTRSIECVMLSCCDGAELQLRASRLDARTPSIDVEILLRELYPTKTDLYERARALKIEYEARGLT
jgi:hypothetical protein